MPRSARPNNLGCFTSTPRYRFRVRDCCDPNPNLIRLSTPMLPCRHGFAVPLLPGNPDPITAKSPFPPCQGLFLLTFQAFFAIFAFPLITWNSQMIACIASLFFLYVAFVVCGSLFSIAATLFAARRAP